MGMLKDYYVGHSDLNACNMLTILCTAPKKTKGEKMDLGTFLTDSSMFWRTCRTSGDRAAADDASSPGFMGRRNGRYANAL